MVTPTAPRTTVLQMLLDERSQVQGDVGGMEALARRLMDAGQYVLAREICFDIVALQPLHAIARLTAVRAEISLLPPQTRNMQRTSHEQTIKHILEECNLDKSAWLEVSAVFERLGDVRAAIAATDRAVAAGADPAAATIRTAYLHYFVGKTRRAAATIKTLLRDPNLTSDHIRTSIALAYKLDKPDVAIAFARKQIELQPEMLQHSVTLALALAQAAKLKEALPLLQSCLPEILATMPPATLLEAASVFNAARRPADELAILVTAAERFPANQKIAEALKTAAWWNSIAQQAI